MRKKTRIFRSKRKQDSEGGFIAKVRKNAPIVIMIVVILVAAHTLYVRHSESEDLKNQIDSSIRRADSLYDAGAWEKAIDEYEGILELEKFSSKKFPDEYAQIQNNIGNTYWDLAGIRDKESNLKKAINAYQEALKIYTAESYPIKYATTQSNLGVMYRNLAEVRDIESNLKKKPSMLTKKP